MVFGFSTGSLFRHMRTPQALGELATHNFNAVEMCLVRLWQYEEDENWTKVKGLMNKFEYVSVHAPSDIDYKKNAQTYIVLNGLTQLNKIRPLNLVVFHPQKEMDLSLFTNLPYPVSFENMDHQKDFGKDLKDLKKVFSFSEQFKMTLDLNHVFTNDITLKLADEFYKEFGDRISEIHLSGFEKLHEPLYKTKQLEIINKVEPNIPIIVESVMDQNEIKNEKDYILKNLNSSDRFCE